MDGLHAVSSPAKGGWATEEPQAGKKNEEPRYVAGSAVHLSKLSTLLGGGGVWYSDKWKTV